jgi:pimeloyl-ACP methyl ester carboxylesterase
MKHEDPEYRYPDIRLIVRHAEARRRAYMGELFAAALDAIARGAQSVASRWRAPAPLEPRRGTRPRHLYWHGLGPTGHHRLHATDWGSKRAARVVICVHGYSGNGRDFDELARALSSEARVICPDIAGRGESDWLPIGLSYNFPQFLSDLRGLLDEIDADEVEWVGTSMGGLIGTLLAAEPGSRIKRLVLNDVGAFVPTDALAEIARNLAAPERFATLAELAAHLKHTHRDWGPISESQWADLARRHARRVGGGYALHYDPRIAAIARPPPLLPGLSLWSAWYRVRCPVLVIRGESSRILPRAVVDAMRAVKPQTRYAQIEGAGHAPSLMAPGQIALVAEFLRDGATRSRATAAARAAIPRAGSSAPAPRNPPAS